MYNDNSVIAQLGVPDMQIPIQYAITYPDRFVSNVDELSLFDYHDLTFEKPDIETFRCLALAFDAMKKGNSYPVIMNAANEVAVDAFLNRKIRYLDIPMLIEEAFANIENISIDKYEDVIDIDKYTREFVSKKIGDLK
jgi:1-deoxy-D-xylulose-5-phosphate reductoisomerase